MPYTQKFRDQHDDLLIRAAEITNYLNEETLRKDASLMRDMLSGMLGKLKLHIDVEDKALYPQLIDSGNLEVSAIAMQYQEDMGEISDYVNSYSRNWPSALAISDKPAKFINETNKLILALKNRIKKENDYLYKLADECL